MPHRFDSLKWLAAAVLLLSSPLILLAFQDEGLAPVPKKPGETAAPKGAIEPGKEAEVQIHREALPITPPTTYKVHLSLEPIRTLNLTAPVDGYVRTLHIKLGGKVAKDSEVIRLDDARAQLVMKGAKARLQGAMAEKTIAQGKGGSSDQLKLADSHVEETQAALDLAKFDLDRLVIRSPLEGEVHRLLVLEGQFVRAGEVVATVVDVSKLQVDVPVDRTAVKAGGELELNINETATKGKVDVMLPLSKPFQPLRDLSDTLQTATVVFDNSQGKLTVGQTVYCDLIPHAPVTSVPTTAVKNQKDGKFRIQVLRRQIVRDIPVKIHSKVGTERVFVSGALQEGDELITSSSQELADGTPVRALLAAANDVTPGAKPAPGLGKKPSDGGF